MSSSSHALVPASHSPHNVPAFTLGRVPDWAFLVLLLAGGSALRAWLFISGRLVFEADQAVFGIGALRILREGTHSIFAPGLSYGADLMSEYLVPWHAVFPPTVALMRLGMLPVFWLLVGSTYAAVSAMTGSRAWALAMAALITFAPSMVTDWSIRASNLYLVPLITLHGALALLFRVLRLPPDAAPARRSVYVAAAGFLLGLGYWGHPVMLVYIGGLAAALAVFPRLLMRLLGFQRRPSVRTAAADGAPTRLDQGLHLALIAVLLLATRLLLLGPPDMLREQQTLPIPAVLGLTLATAGALLIAQIQVTRRTAPRLLPFRLGVVVLTLALWGGAFPVIWHIWVQERPLLDVAKVTHDPATAWQQLASVFHTALPVLLGWYHTWRVPTEGIPAALKAAALAGYALAWPLLLVLCRRRQTAHAERLAIAVYGALAIVQISLFALSPAGTLSAEPRYLFILYWGFAFAVAGAAAHLWERRRRASRISSAILLGVVLAGNIGSNMSVRSQPLFDLPGIRRGEKRLLNALHEAGITRVSCRFSAQGYWHAYLLSYLSNETILFAPADVPHEVRSRRYQDAVDQTTSPAYLVRTDEVRALEGFLNEQKVSYRRVHTPKYTVFHSLTPDPLRQLSGVRDLRKPSKP